MTAFFLPTEGRNSECEISSEPDFESKISSSVCEILDESFVFNSRFPS